MQVPRFHALSFHSHPEDEVLGRGQPMLVSSQSHIYHAVQNKKTNLKQHLFAALSVWIHREFKDLLLASQFIIFCSLLQHHLLLIK